MITTSTKLVGLFGKPIAHSFSSEMQNRVFWSRGLDYYYLPIECELEDIRDIVGGIRRMNFAGFNVTRPYKVVIMQYLDKIDHLAKLIGSVNTVKKVDNQLVGYNTDGIGFIESIKKQLKFDVKGKKFFIIGAGGAARAVSITLAESGAGQILITDLIQQMASDLVDHINASGRPCATLVGGTPDEIRSAVESSHCLINASGVGMHPDTHLSPVDRSCLRSDLTICDLTYNPEKTQLLLDAESIGSPIMNGLGMLVNQGAKAFEIWTGLKSPASEMMAICKEILARNK